VRLQLQRSANCIKLLADVPVQALKMALALGLKTAGTDDDAGTDADIGWHWRW
jgi:hypothetical protein